MRFGRVDRVPKKQHISTEEDVACGGISDWPGTYIGGMHASDGSAP